MIDLTRLRSITGGDVETEKMLLRLFLETANRILNELEKGQNWRARVHELKGAAANLGLNSLHIACQAAEENEPQAEAPHALLSEIKQVITEVGSLIA